MPVAPIVGKVSLEMACEKVVESADGTDLETPFFIFCARLLLACFFLASPFFARYILDYTL